MRRIVILGSSGAGKTTLAKGLSSALGIHHIELDAICHQSEWRELDDQAFREELCARLAAHPDGWITCGNYARKSRGVHVLAADTIIWLDLPRWLVMRRLLMRTLVRTLTRKELWNGNREHFRNLFKLDPHKNILLWSWTRWKTQRQRYERCMEDGTWAHATVLRLTSAADVAKLMRTVAASVA